MYFKKHNAKALKKKTLNWSIMRAKSSYPHTKPRHFCVALRPLSRARNQRSTNSETHFSFLNYGV